MFKSRNTLKTLAFVVNTDQIRQIQLSLEAVKNMVPLQMQLMM